MEKLPKVIVTILNFNGKDTIKACLDSVNRSDYANLEMIVVDNASKDGSFELAKHFFSKAAFILNESNLGYARGNNIAIRYALERMADYVLLLNNDALVETDTISKLAAAAEKDGKIGILSPVIYREDGKVWFSGGKINWFRMKAIHENKAVSDKPYETEFLSGCAIFIRKEVFKEIGLLDENYFLYYEDVDFCVRARRKGLKTSIMPQARAKHFEKSQGNLENKTYWLVLSGLIFFKKNAPAILRHWINFYLFLRKIKNWREVKFKKNDLAKTVQKAYWDYKKLNI